MNHWHHHRLVVETDGSFRCHDITAELQALHQDLASQLQPFRGKAFVAGVIERAGSTGLDPLFDRPTAIPTPSELEAPGLWLARLEISDDA